MVQTVYYAGDAARRFSANEALSHTTCYGAKSPDSSSGNIDGTSKA